MDWLPYPNRYKGHLLWFFSSTSKPNGYAKEINKRKDLLVDPAVAAIGSLQKTGDDTPAKAQYFH
jgi:hypothetical protein